MSPSPPHPPATVLIVGDSCSAEMVPVRARIDGLAAVGADVRIALDLTSASARGARDHWFAELIVVCQHWPDEFPDRDVLRLFGENPLARIVCSYALWCDSDGRSRAIWPAAVRVPVRCASERIDHELDVLAGRCPALPLTASRDEIFLYDARMPIDERLACR